MKYKVFVYGTLKKGKPNHRIIQHCKGSKAYAPGIDLFAGPSFPFAKRGSRIAIGEVYEVDQETLVRLDHLEGHPTFYQREKTNVLINGSRSQAWIYLFPNADKYPAVTDGEW
jgi:gamma-glutamylcyclotransferase (GGCT)/AIG2-like uncharacterized protein YtfP